MIEILGGSPEDIAVNLQVAAGDLVSVFNKAGIDRFHSYLGWANAQVRMFAGRISQHDIERLIQTRGYWALRTSDPAALGDNLSETISREMEAQKYALENAAKEVNAELQRWHGKGHDPVALILDTGLLERYAEQLDSVDWHDIADLRPHRFVYLVIPRVVLDELDRHKQSKNTSEQGRLVRVRARAAIKALWAMFGTRERPNTFAHAASVPVREGRFELLNDSIDHVQRADPDGEILDRSRTLRPYLPVKVITFDTGMALRGMAAGIDVVLSKDPSDTD